MKLTPEQQKALEEAMQERFPRTDMPTLPGEEAAFLAGCRYQHQITLERAAKVCEQLAGINAGHRVPDFVCGTEADSCAALIRTTLPYETKDE